MSQPTDASVQLAHLAANEDWTKWQRVALDKLARELGIDTSALETREQAVAAIQARVDEHRRATVPEPPVPAAEVYRVIGPHIVHGTKPGKTFAAVLPADQRAALIEGGHIKHEKENT